MQTKAVRVTLYPIIDRFDATNDWFVTIKLIFSPSDLSANDYRSYNPVMMYFTLTLKS